MLSALLLALPAQAWESEPQEFLIAHDVELFTGSELDSDWLPADSPIAVRFQIVADGGASAEMEGVGSLTWPEGLNLALTGEPDTGWLAVDAALAAVTSVRFDLYGWEYESELDRREIAVSGETTFSPFLLDGASPDVATVSTVGASTEVIDYEYEVFAGVSLGFNAGLAPTSTTTLSGIAWWLGDQQIAAEGESAVVEASGTGQLDLAATFMAEWQSELDLVLTPEVEVCIPIYGCFSVASFDIPLALATDDIEEGFPELALSFPLPVIGVDVQAYDFGEVEVGTFADLALDIHSQGLMDLQGEAGLIGSPYFTVFPESILAAPATSDGVVVSFAPESAGAFEGTLLLSTNDPATPTLEILLTGTGVDPEEEQAEDYEVIKSEVGCGCASGGRPGAGWFAAIAAAALLRRRATGRTTR